MSRHETIYIKAGGERVPVKAEMMSAEVAVHEAIGGPGWAVTHVPTGRTMSKGRFSTAERAAAYAQRVMALGLDLDFGSTAEMQDEDRERLRELFSEAHSGHEHELWPVLSVGGGER